MIVPHVCQPGNWEVNDLPPIKHGGGEDVYEAFNSTAVQTAEPKARNLMSTLLTAVWLLGL